MPAPSDIISTVAVLMNDSAQTQYTNAICLPYLNLALDELQEIYELNGIPVTNKTSSPPITMIAGNNILGFSTTPSLPSDLIEIQQLWESTSGLNQWTPMLKKDFLPHYLEDGTTISMFLIWAWLNEQVNLIAANANNDLKIDYTASIFATPILIGNVGVSLPSFTNIKTYLEYKTAALCAMFIAENPERAVALDSLTMSALSRSLGVPIRGMQSITTRRRPFRHSFKHRGASY